MTSLADLFGLSFSAPPKNDRYADLSDKLVGQRAIAAQGELMLLITELAARGVVTSAPSVVQQTIAATILRVEEDIILALGEWGAPSEQQIIADIVDNGGKITAKQEAYFGMGDLLDYLASAPPLDDDFVGDCVDPFCPCNDPAFVDETDGFDGGICGDPFCECNDLLGEVTDGSEETIDDNDKAAEAAEENA